MVVFGGGRPGQKRLAPLVDEIARDIAIHPRVHGLQQPAQHAIHGIPVSRCLADKFQNVRIRHHIQVPHPQLHGIPVQDDVTRGFHHLAGFVLPGLFLGQVPELGIQLSGLVLQCEGKIGRAFACAPCIAFGNEGPKPGPTFLIQILDHVSFLSGS